MKKTNNLSQPQLQMSMKQSILNFNQQNQIQRLQASECKTYNRLQQFELITSQTQFPHNNNLSTVKIMLGNFLNHIPPVTQVQLFVIGLIGLLTYGQIVDKYNLYFNVEKIFYQGEVWRLVTSLACFKQQNLYFLLQLYFFISISSSVERSSFKRGSIDFLYFLILMSGLIYFFAIVLKINFLSNIYIYAMYYYYGRIHSNRIIIINFLPMRASFMIWFILLIQWIFGSHDLKSCLLSIVIGHTLYFIYNVYPKLRFAQNKEFFDTPNLFVRLVAPLFNEQNAQRNNQEGDDFF